MTEFSESKIDKRQLKTLLSAALKTDLRGSRNPMDVRGNRASKFPPIVGTIILYGFVGLFLAFYTFFLKNPFTASLIVYTSMSLFIGITILLEFSNLILSPEEYEIVAPQPVNSKTFFAVKLIHMLLYVNILGAFLYLPSAITVSITNSNILLFFSFILAGLLAVTAIGMIFVILYTLVLKIFNREVMQRVSGYAQLIMISLYYFGCFVAPRLIGKNAAGIAQKLDTSWLYFVPVAWFSAIAKLPSGSITFIDLGAAFMGIFILIIFFRIGISRLSLGYARTLS